MHEGDEQDDASRTARREKLRRARLAHYRRQGTALEMSASPRRPVAPSADAAGPGVHDDPRPLLGCVSAGLTVVYVGQLIEEALLSRADLVVPLRITFVLAILAAAASVAAVVRLARGKAMAPAEGAVPWQDVVEGVRLGEVEPSNPAWPVAASLVEEVRPVVQAALAQARTEERLARIREAGALVHATAEEWRERQARRPGSPGTALDRHRPRPAAATGRPEPGVGVAGQRRVVRRRARPARPQRPRPRRRRVGGTSRRDVRPPHRRARGLPGPARPAGRRDVPAGPRAGPRRVEAIRGCEQRVRALELSSPSLSATDAPVLGAELHRLASGAWTLVGQECAEERLLDDPDDPDGLDPGERRD